MLAGRSTLCRKTKVVPIECVVRGYLAGSGWNEYRKSGTVCGIALPSGLTESDSLAGTDLHSRPRPRKGTTKTFRSSRRSKSSARKRRTNCAAGVWTFSNAGRPYALERGIIIADTKFEFGRIGNEMILIDEVLTPDSSRFWPADQYAPGRGQPSFDKQFVRDWLSATPWDKNSPPPSLPDDIVMKTREKYVEAYERLTGKKFVS